MAPKSVGVPAKHLFNGFRRYQQSPQPAHGMATGIDLPNSTLSETYKDALITPKSLDSASVSPAQNPVPSITHPPTRFQPQPNPFLTTTTCTLHTFPALEPTRFVSYPSTHLLVPLRKDILHRAVIFEGDATRQGTASTLWRNEVRGSGRKIRPQKGTGSARLGDKKSPMLRGGGVAFGPKPRDFSTELPEKIYDFAWRIALSYRYRMGQLVVLEDKADLSKVHDASRSRYLREMLQHNRMGNADGGSLFITAKERKSLANTLEEDNLGKHASCVSIEDVDVKDLLERGRLVVEREALEWMLRAHQSDLDNRLQLRPWKGIREKYDDTLLGEVPVA